MFVKDHVDTLVYWIREREKVRGLKESGAPRPWTKDPLIANTRFCNVRRMDDKVSRWLVQNYYPRPGSQSVGSMLTAATVARLVNWPDTLQELYRDGWQGKWEPRYFVDCLLARKRLGHKVFTGVYIINAATATDADRECGGAKIKVVSRIIDEVSSYKDRLVVTASMQATHQQLQSVSGIGSFIAGQIVADLRHVVKGGWHDKEQWAPKGPGSSRGMLYLLGEDKQKSLSDRDFIDGMAALLPVLRQRVPKIWHDRQLEAMDAQNTLCELAKFVRLQNGGRSKNKYPGGL